MSDVFTRGGRAVGALVAFTLGGLGLTALPAGATDNGDGTVTVDIAAISDLHGHIETAGALSAKVNEMRAANPDTIFAANGDLVGGSAYVSSIDNDTPTLEIMNAMKLDVTSVGNHEFDKGYSDLIDRIAPSSNYPWLSANVDGVDPSVVPPFAVLRTPSGVRVGFVGTVTDDLPTLVSPSGIEGLTVTDPVAATDKYAAILKDGDETNGEADIVVALMHADVDFGAKVGPNVDAVVAGHTHQDKYRETASGAPVIEPECFGSLLAKISFVYDKNAGKLVSTKAENLGVSDNDGVDATIQALYEKAAEKAKILGARVVGSIDGVANRGTNNGTDLGANRGAEFSANNLIAEAFYQYSQGMAQKADFGIMNPGGVRADLDPNGDGEITLEESYTMQPFGNTYTTIQLNSAQVYTLFEEQWNANPEAARPILRLGMSKSITYTYDPTAPVGSKVTGVYLNGELLDRSDTSKLYTVVSNQFLIAGGDGFNVLKEGLNYNDTGLIDNDVFNLFLEANPNYKVTYEQHSIGVSGVSNLTAGKSADIALSSLSMTSVEPKPEKVTLYLDGQELGTATVDNTVTPNRDETGQATVSVTIPESVTAGTHELRIVAEPTDFTMQVEVAAAAAPEKPVIHPNTFQIDTDGDGVADQYVNYGRASDTPLVGDWNGDGIDTPAVKRGELYFISDSFDGGAATTVFAYGRESDTPLVGDWDGDGKDTIAVRRGNTVYINNTLSGGNASEVFHFGRATDEALAGDFDGDGKDTVAVKRANGYYIKNELAGGNADYSFAFGHTSDKPLVGDWDGDGKDTVSVLRGNTVYVSNAERGGGATPVKLADVSSSSVVLSGDFNGNKVDTFAVR
ncbi:MULTISPECIES: 5'-nucleotidase C-terminal domain-containing protein [unclassified Actinobaculum]|uniref:5'-nucleotidase C-terminal domain-containing protein n=1 Tax=unclassified Actinobaculum TaxID=2609299 RepID=UPI000D525B29|nr:MULTISPECIES: 5'-nucleotidase C-terminal domain-containing protein [unclassified Actinobaculum]AWE43063.1 hypothetical protein DDD63_10315 [Actinobaculum sp. 313]RTE48552.1 bifunctional metallophosphatase/5'-nucleotidase [Actinobaculum sp. 352]